MIFIPARSSRIFAIPDVERMTSAALAVGVKWLVPKITTVINGYQRYQRMQTQRLNKRAPSFKRMRGLSVGVKGSRFRGVLFYTCNKCFELFLSA